MYKTINQLSRSVNLQRHKTATFFFKEAILFIYYYIYYNDKVI